MAIKGINIAEHERIVSRLNSGDHGKELRALASDLSAEYRKYASLLQELEIVTCRYEELKSCLRGKEHAWKRQLKLNKMN